MPPPKLRARQRLAATPHPLFLQRTLVSRKRAKIGARAGPIWHYVALRRSIALGNRLPLVVSLPARQRLAATPHPLFLQRTLVSRKRAKIGARAGPIWHYAALRGTTWHKAPPTCTRTCAFEGPLGSPRRAIQPSSREKTAHDLRVGELQWTPENGENVTNRTVNAPLKTGQNEEIGNAAVRAASGERAARARLPITVIGACGRSWPRRFVERPPLLASVWRPPRIHCSCSVL